MTESRDSITVINNDSDNKDSQKDVLATTDGQGKSKGNEENKMNDGETEEAKELADSELIEEAGEGEELATEEHPENSRGIEGSNADEGRNEEATAHATVVGL